MIGDRVHRVARRLLREDTCTRIVVPAIADLQFEAPGGTWARVRGYVGVWRGLGCAILIEIGHDCMTVIRATRIGSVAGPALLTLALTGALSFAPMLWMTFGRSPAPWHHDLVLFVLMAPRLFAAVAPSLALPGAAALARTAANGSRRAALFLTITVMMIIVSATHITQWHLNDLFVDMFYTSNTSVRAGDQDRRLWELRQKFVDQREALKARDPRVRERFDRQHRMRRFTRIEGHRLASLAVLVIPFALLGVVWSKKGRWTTGVLGGGVFFAFGVLQLALHQLFYVRQVLGFVVALWAPVMLLLLTALLITVRARRLRAA